MRTAYYYRLQLTQQSANEIDRWLSVSCAQYNYLLGDWFNKDDPNRCSINACSLVDYSPELKDKLDYCSPEKTLSKPKETHPWYQEFLTTSENETVAISQHDQEFKKRLSLERDHKAAINIKNRVTLDVVNEFLYRKHAQRAERHPVLKAHRVSESVAGVDEKPTLYPLGLV